MHTYIHVYTYRHTVYVYQYGAIMLLRHMHCKPHLSSPHSQLLYTQEQGLPATMGVHTCAYIHAYMDIRIHMHIVPCAQVLHDNQDG